MRPRRVMGASWARHGLEMGAGVDVDRGVDMDVDQTGPRWTTLDVDAVDKGVDDGLC